MPWVARIPPPSINATVIYQNILHVFYVALYVIFSL